MSSDGDTIRRPKRHKMISDSDSDDSIVQSHRRKKFHRLVSESDNSDDDSDLPKPVVRRKNYKIKSENETESDSEEWDDNDADFIIESDSSQWQSDWRSEDEIEPVESSMEAVVKEEKVSDGYDSDKSDGTSEKCPICLLPFRKQEVATPSSCEHCFCLECIVEWSKNINTCPVDRTSFTVINVRNKFAGQIVRHIPIEVKPPVEDSIIEDPTFCEICHQSDREDRMLLCDGCDSGYHLECLTPPLSQVPIEEWFCPDCSQNSQFDAEAVDIDMDEVPDLMEEARRLGLSYGRTRGTEIRNHAGPRLIPRTRQTERVQANIRAHRITIHHRPRVPIFDPNQPSTSSGLESVSENSRSRSPASMRSQASTSRGPRGTTSRRSKPTKTKRKKKKRTGSSTTELRKVVITEINEDGEEQQTVSYVKVTSTSRKKSRKKSRKRRRVRRTIKTGPKSMKKRLVKALGLGPKMAAVKQTGPSEVTEVSSAKFRAGIPQLSLFGNNLGLDFSPPGSEDETEVIIGTGPCVQTRPRTALNATRRRMALKGIVNPVPEPAPESFDLLSSILENQKLWHSKKTSKVTVKADGSLLLESPDTKTDDKQTSINNNKSPVKKTEDDKALDLSNVNPNSITQAPMYNSRGGGGGNRGGHFRSNNYRENNNRHSYAGQNYNTHESYTGNRHSYGGAGNNRDFNSPTNYNSNFDHRNQTPPFSNQFRNRNPNFRNRFAAPENDRPPFSFPDQGMRFPRPRMPNTSVLPPPPAMNLHNPPPLMSMDLSQPSQDNLDVQDMAPEPVEAPGNEEEDCDLYSDIQAPTKVDAEPQENVEDVLLPPPEPPSGLLDFEENSKSEKDNDSDQELVIDDTPKEETKEKEKGEKYDPFDDSESNDSKSDKKDKEPESGLPIPVPMDPPPMPNFAGLELNKEEEKEEKTEDQPSQSNSLMNLTAYEDEEDEESQSDCPNFSIYSSQTMDVARHSQEEMAQICPLEPPPLPPMMPDDNDVVEGDVQGCDFAEVPEPPPDRVDPYVQALQKERQTLNKFPPKKILDDSRGKITFKLQSKMRLNNKLSNLYDELDENVEISIDQDKQKEKEKEKVEKKELEKEDMDVDVDKMLEETMEVEKEEVEVPTESQLEKRDEEVVKGAEQFVPILVPSMIPMPPSGDRTPTIDENQDDELQGNDGSHTPVIDEPGSTPPLLKDSDDRESSNLTPPLISKNLNLLRPPSEKETYTPERPAESDDTPKPKESAMRIPDMRSLVHAEGEYSRGTSLYDDDDSVQFPLEKDANSRMVGQAAASTWESDGAYTPCKDELPVKESSGIESGLEPISPSKDKSDEMGGVRTPAGYAGLGTEAISETEETMNYEEEPSANAKKTKEKDKEMEEGEIMDENKAARSRERMRSKEDDKNKKNKKKDKKDKTTKETEKNKENISSENMVAWKKISKSTKERQYREKDKRSRSKERSRKKERETPKKKEKRKELPRYDVRKLVAEKPRKDAYGRDLRNDSRSLSRSLSRLRRSRSYSRGRSRSRSRASWGRGCRSLSRKRSRSRSKRREKKRSISREREKSLSRKRSVSRRKSRSPRRRSRRRSVSRKRRSRSRSRERRKEKLPKKHRSRSRSKNRKRSRTRSPKRISSRSRDKKHVKRKAPSRSRSISRDRNRNWEVMPEKPIETHFPRSNRDERESWSAQWTPSWSVERSTRSLSPRRQSASPPMLNDVPPKNLTVILTNKDAIKKKKKEKRKEVKKMKDVDKRRKLRKNRVAPPSKEVFASGDNILVSVCFNEENETNASQIAEIPEALPILVPTKRRRREAVQIVEPAAKKTKKDKVKDKRSKSPKAKKDKKKKSKAAEIAATKKPVAVIDLDQSPFREQTPSPRDVIVLSDDDDKVAPAARQPEQVEPSSSSQRTPQHEQFVQGPKTPPEPQVKFSITKQTNNLRPSMMNPLLEEDEEEEKEEGTEKDKDQDKALNSNKRIAYCDSRSRSVSIDRNTKWDMQELEMRQKIGPNTPPERPLSHSPPTSPDAYDPFDPTKSRSPSPVASQEATSTDGNQRSSPRKHDVPAATTADAPKGTEETTEKQDVQVEKVPEKPKIISMVTIKRASPIRDDSPVADSQTETSTGTSESPSKAQPNQQNSQPAANPFPTMNPVLATVAAAVQRSSLFNANTIGQRNLLQANRISPNTQTKPQRSNDRPQLPNIFVNSVKPMTAPRSGKSAQNKGAGQNGNDANADVPNDIVDMSSPYSPGSSLSDGIFDPPSPANYNGSPAALVTNSKNNLPKNKDKKDLFDALFDSAPLMKLNAMKTVKKKAVDKKKKSSYQTPSSASNAKIGVRMDENQLQILDDLPSSAVEMQVKDKFLKKLNRQERVVEEVKLVLKPHYTKKHVTKEEYKDIMRKAVPKICHNKSGEINPKKIAHLIEAYVKKCRNSKKKSFATNPTTSTAAASTANATAKTVTSKTKNLWS